MRVLTAVIAIASGVIVLLGYFIPGIAGLDLLRLTLTEWAVIIAGMAVLVGVFNLVLVQWGKIGTRQKGWGYSVILVVSLLGTALYGSIAGLDNPIMKFTVDAVIIPVEASLLAILAVTLVYASIRLLRRRIDMMSVIFLITVVLFLLAIMPTLFGPIPVVGELIIGFTGMISRGGARGLLIGVALGTLLTGLRVLFGIDRPYGGN
jgi:hypothetical protein